MIWPIQPSLLLHSAEAFPCGVCHSRLCYFEVVESVSGKVVPYFPDSLNVNVEGLVCLITDKSSLCPPMMDTVLASILVAQSSSPKRSAVAANASKRRIPSMHERDLVMTGRRLRRGLLSCVRSQIAGNLSHAYRSVRPNAWLLVVRCFSQVFQKLAIHCPVC